MINHGLGDKAAFPPEKAGPQAQIGIVAIGKEIFVESAGLLQNSPAKNSSTSVGKEAVTDLIELTPVDLSTSPASILAVRENEVSRLIDAAAVGEKNLGGAHPDARRVPKRPDQKFQPAGVGLGVVVEQGDKAASRLLETSIVGSGKTEVPVQADPAYPLGGKFLGYGQARIGGSVVNHQDFIRGKGLPLQRKQTLPQQLGPITIDDHHGQVAVSHGLSPAAGQGRPIPT